MRTLQRIVRWPFVQLINLYQHTLSPDHGWLSGFYPHGYCKFDPTCSEYTKQAIEKHGVLLGSIMGSWRILRCNPWSQGGKDPVPQKFKEAFKKSK